MASVIGIEGELDIVQRSVNAALHADLSALRDKAISEAAAKFEADLRTGIGQTVLRVADFYEIQRAGSRLIIEAKTRAS